MGASDGEHYGVHHDEAQAQGERAEECGGTAMGAEVSGFQFHGESGAKAADRAESGAAIQREGPGANATDAGRDGGENGRGVGPLSSRMDWLFRPMPDALGVAKP